MLKVVERRSVLVAARCWIGTAVAWICAVAVIVAAVGCASNSGTPDRAAGPETPEATPIPFDLESVRLVPTVGEFDSFRMDVPEGWEVETTRIPGGFTHEYVLKNDYGMRVAVVSVQCRVGISVDAMMAEDQRVVQGVGGRYVIGNAGNVTLAGSSGRQLDYGVSLAGVPVDYRSIYLYKEPCGWRLTLAAFGRGQFDQFLPLYYRVVATFQPAAFEVPFEDRDPYAGDAQQAP